MSGETPAAAGQEVAESRCDTPAGGGRRYWPNVAAPLPAHSAFAAPAADPPIYVATANLGKLHEMRNLFFAAGRSLTVYAGYRSPREGDRSYADNAALKAHSLYDILRSAGPPQDVLADDSGLEVRALDGRPGVATADYGGPGAAWSERRARLLDELAAAGADRRARFVCALHFIDAAGREFASLGTVDGEIAAAERGNLGFSFDPVFVYPPAAKTFAEMTDEQKNSVSHRAIAVAAIVAAIRAAAVRLPP